MKNFSAALFDLDGVIVDTEPQYSRFWGDVLRHYHPGSSGLEQKIKGQTLCQIFDQYFSGPLEACRAEVVARLDDFEQQMDYPLIAGCERFIAELRQRGVRTAIVTSSNKPKMQSLYTQRPVLKEWFDAILTAEDFERSKPDPDCYLKAAAQLGAGAGNCVVFEDSINGLRAGRAAGMYVVGLSTTNPKDVIAKIADVVYSDFEDIMNNADFLSE